MPRTVPVQIIVDISPLIESLRQRAVQLDNEAVSATAANCVTEPYRAPEMLFLVAAEFRRIADMAEARAKGAGNGEGKEMGSGAP